MKSIKNWEDYFQDSILSVEEYLSKNSSDKLLQNKSKLQIALDQKFLTWFEYKEWAKEHYGYPVLNVVDSRKLLQLQKNYQNRHNLFTTPNIWSEDLIAIDQWDEQLIILGLEPNEKLYQIKNYIFILCSPELLKIISQDQNHISQEISHEIPAHLKTAVDDNNNESSEFKIELIDDSEISIDEQEISATDATLTSVDTEDLLSFDPIETPVVLENLTASIEKTVLTNENALTNQLVDDESQETTEETKSIFGYEKDSTTNMNDRIWNNLAEHHDAYATKVRKQFDAYLVLKVTAEQTTEVYRMDEDLAKEDINFNVFKYDLKTTNPFQNVYKNHYTETFNISQLGLKILDFRYVCVSVLKLGTKVVGFLVGFKTTNLSQEDISTLESISEKAV